MPWATSDSMRPVDLREHFPIVVDASEAGLRLDQILSARFPEVSRARWTKLLREGVFESAAKVLKASVKVSEGMTVAVSAAFQGENEKFSEPRELFSLREFRGTAPTVLYEDEDLLVLNKPRGLAVHAGAGLAPEETLVAWLLCEKKITKSPKGLSWGPSLIEGLRPGIVHRLDRETSGALVVAKNPHIHTQLSEQFASKEAGRIYWARTKGRLTRLPSALPPPAKKLLSAKDAPVVFRLEARLQRAQLVSYLSRDPSHRTRFRVSPDGSGKKAVSHFKLLWESELDDESILEVRLETGRTHQIRVHLAFLGLPILGDALYSRTSDASAPMYLHARELHFRHPGTGELLKFKAPCSDHWLNFFAKKDISFAGAQK